MQILEFLSDFLEAIQTDNRIAPCHISLYAVLVYFYAKSEYIDPISICPREMMPLVKNSSATTFYKSIRDLHEFGYIKYVPSYNPAIRSQVFLLRKAKELIE